MEPAPSVHRFATSERSGVSCEAMCHHPLPLARQVAFLEAQIRCLQDAGPHYTARRGSRIAELQHELADLRRQLEGPPRPLLGGLGDR